MQEMEKVCGNRCVVGFGVYPNAVVAVAIPVANDGREDREQSVGDTVLAFMIEKKGAVDNLEEILSLNKVEMVQWGGADFSMNIGHPREMNHPDVVAAKKKTFEMAIKMGVPPRAEIGSADETKEYLDMGVRHFSVGTDIVILHDYWKREGEGVRKALGGS